MPLYDYKCERGHTTEERQGIEVESIPCPRILCGLNAPRVGVYREQFMQAETGPIGGKRNPVPDSDQRYGQGLSEYVEATGEVAYQYEKAGKTPPDLLAVAKKKARAIRAAR